jgi:hypothetical protein
MSDGEAATNSAGDAAKAELELLKLRFDYAWKHFDFHAKQRTTMFQYFVTIAPLIIGLYFYFLKEKPVTQVNGILMAIAFIGVVLSIIFGLLDRRNRQLYGISQRNLKLLETNNLYKTPLDSFHGIMTEEEQKYGRRRYNIMKFRCLMPCLYFGSMLSFAAMMYVGWKF